MNFRSIRRQEVIIITVLEGDGKDVPYHEAVYYILDKQKDKNKDHTMELIHIKDWKELCHVNE